MRGEETSGGKVSRYVVHFQMNKTCEARSNTSNMARLENIIDDSGMIVTDGHTARAVIADHLYSGKRLQSRGPSRMLNSENIDPVALHGYLHIAFFPNTEYLPGAYYTHRRWPRKLGYFVYAEHCS